MCKILKRDKLKNRAETGKRLSFQGFEGKFLQFAPEWSGQKIPLSSLKMEPETKKNKFEQICDHSLNFKPLFFFISEVNPTF